MLTLLISGGLAAFVLAAYAVAELAGAVQADIAKRHNAELAAARGAFRRARLYIPPVSFPPLPVARGRRGAVATGQARRPLRRAA